MKKFKSFFYASACMAAAVFASSCDKEPQNGGGSEEETPAVIFKAKASDITTNGAVLTITHDGTKDDTFYGFCYDDIATGTDDAIAKKVAELKASGKKLSDIVFKGTSYKHTLNALEPEKTYKYVAFGLKADGTVYGTPAAVTFTTEKEPVAKTTYEDWLGTWTITGNNGVSNEVIIESNVTGESYFISGLQSFSDKINCNYNEDGSLSIITTDLEDYTDNTYGPIDVWFLGNYLNSDGNTYSITGDYTICYGVMSDKDNATFTGNSITLSDNVTVEVIGMECIGLILEGEYAGYVLTYLNESPSLPAQMTRTAAAAVKSTMAAPRMPAGKVTANAVAAK